MQIHLITGISGSGKSVALRAFEDAGFDCIDNLPVSLLEALITTLETENRERVAVAIDARRGDSIAQLPQLLEKLQANHQVRVLFINADTNTLVQRFSETRRRHPLSVKAGANPNQTIANTLIEALELERKLLEPLSKTAHSIDTSNLPAHTLRSWIQDLIKDKPVGLTVILESFGFKKGLPNEADLVFDVRCLPNPYYDKLLRPLTGRDELVKNFLPHYIADGRSYLTIAIGCTGGQHRSVYLINRLGQALEKNEVSTLPIHLLYRHRELDSNPEK